MKLYCFVEEIKYPDFTREAECSIVLAADEERAWQVFAKESVCFHDVESAKQSFTLKGCFDVERATEPQRIFIVTGGEYISTTTHCFK